MVINDSKCDKLTLLSGSLVISCWCFWLVYIFGIYIYPGW